MDSARDKANRIVNEVGDNYAAGKSIEKRFRLKDSTNCELTKALVQSQLPFIGVTCGSCQYGLSASKDYQFIQTYEKTSFNKVRDWMGWYNELNPNE